MIETNQINIKHHSNLVSISFVLVNVLKSYHLDYHKILEEAGFNADKEYLSTDRVSFKKTVKLWELSVQYSKDPCIGLVYATHIQPSSLHGLGFSFLASCTLKDGLERLVRFQRILSTQLILKLKETDNGYALFHMLINKERSIQIPDAAIHGRIAAVYKICQLMMGPELRPLRVSFEHPEPQCIDKFTEFFNTEVTFNARETGIIFDKQTCEMVMTSVANPELARINDKTVIHYLEQFEQRNLVTKTRNFIIDHLPSGVPKQSIIARDLNLSLRNFQRKLEQAETNYKTLLNEVRYEMACDYLSLSDYQIIQIAYFLGFSDPSNFGRAFKRWSGLSPQHFRQNSLNAMR